MVTIIYIVALIFLAFAAAGVPDQRFIRFGWLGLAVWLFAEHLIPSLP